jgi:hypothetical protein
MWKTLLCTASLVFFSGTALFAQDKSADLAIVVNPASALESVSSAELAKILKMDTKKSPDGVKYVVALRSAGSPEENALLKGIYQMSEAECQKYFLQATFAGTIQAAPKQLASGAAVRQFVASEKGAISGLCASEADATVKVLKIDGKSPGDAGYPLKLK